MTDVETPAQDEEVKAGEQVAQQQPQSAPANQGSSFKNPMSNKSDDKKTGGLKDAAKNKIKDEGKKMVAKKAAEIAGKAAGDATGVPIVGEVTGKIAAKVAGDLMDKEKRKKYILLILILLGGPIAFIFLFVAIWGGSGAAFSNQMNNQQNNPLTIQKTGPEAVPNSNNFTYTITVNDAESYQDMIITDTLDKNTQFVNSPQWKKYSLAGNIITWKMSDNVALPSGGMYQASVPQSFTFTVKPLVVNNYVFNIGATAQVIGGGGSSTGAGSSAYVPPSSNNCSGKYAAYIAKSIFLPKNWGDPLCNYNKNQLYTLLLQLESQQIDPVTKKPLDPATAKKFADIWFTTVLPGEFPGGAVFNPMSNNDNDPLDFRGSWGMFQMSATTRAVNGVMTDNPPLPSPAHGKNGEFDRGDGNWQWQIQNAINYNHTVTSCSFMYWAGWRACVAAHQCQPISHC